MTTWHFTGPPGGKVDDLGFECPWSSSSDLFPLIDNDLEEARQDYAKFWSDYFPVVMRRRKRWEKADPRKNPRRLKRFVYKGIPAPLRKEIWLRNCAPRGAPRMVNVPESVVEAIRIDLPRTFPNNQYLQTERVRNALGRVLYSLAQHVPSVGYCQARFDEKVDVDWTPDDDCEEEDAFNKEKVVIPSLPERRLFLTGFCKMLLGLNYVAGVILLVLKDESKAADLLVQMVKQRQDYYNDRMSGLRRDTKVLQWILGVECPQVARVLKNLDVGLDLFIGKWLLCWFVETLPLETVLRIWDCMIYDGNDVWLFRVTICLIRSHQRKIGNVKTLEQLVRVFQEVSRSRKALYCHQLIESAKAEKVSQTMIDELRAMCEPDDG